MESVVDARGMVCPEPVVCAKKALEALEAGSLTAIVDDEVARDNVVSMARTMACQVRVEEKGDEFYIHIRKGVQPAAVSGLRPTLSQQVDQVLLVTGNYLGRGNEELAQTLMANLFYVFAESDVYPKTMIFLNTGVFLTCEGSPVLSHLWALEQKGVEVLSSGTCLDFYGLKPRLCVGKLTTMYAIAENLMAAQKVITI